MFKVFKDEFEWFKEVKRKWYNAEKLSVADLSYMIHVISRDEKNTLKGEE